MSGFDTKHKILTLLGDGHFHSGEDLGQLLGMSRAAVGKHIGQLGELGVDIFSVRGKGYSLSNSLTLLSSEKISSYYHHLVDENLEIEVKHVIGSTNDHLLQQIRNSASLNSGACVVAECQTAGRGRRGRAWVSPFGSHIYFSMYWQLDGIQQAMGLSIAVGIAAREVIQSQMTSAVQVKWPNDLLVEQHKIAGILVELEGQADGPCRIVIGIGINVNMPDKQAEGIDQPWTDIVSHRQSPVDRNELIALLVMQMKDKLNNFEQNQLRKLATQWNHHDRFFNQPIELHMGSRRLSGIGKGIDQQGGILILEDGASVEKAYYGGEISLRGRT